MAGNEDSANDVGGSSAIALAMVVLLLLVHIFALILSKFAPNMSTMDLRSSRAWNLRYSQITSNVTYLSKGKVKDRRRRRMSSGNQWD